MILVVDNHETFVLESDGDLVLEVIESPDVLTIDINEQGPAGADGEQGPPGPITQTRLGLSVVAFDTNGAVTGVMHANGDTVDIGYNVDGEVVQVDKTLDGVSYHTTITYSPTEIELNTVEL